MTNPAVRRQIDRKADYEDGLDFYPTPPWCTRVLCEHVPILGGDMTVWDPAAGAGHMTDVITWFKDLSGGAGGLTTIESDLRPMTESIHQLDFLNPLDHERIQREKNPNWAHADWIVTNPPFRLLDEFIKVARARSHYQAFFCRLQGLEGKKRGKLFKERPPSQILIFSERVRGMTYGGFDFSKGSMAAYCWLVFEKPFKETKVKWITDEDRKRNERPNDYDGWLVKGEGE